MDSLAAMRISLLQAQTLSVLLMACTIRKSKRYDNYDAIEVSRVDRIPCDYDGVMGVPITFMDKYNPEQFEIVAFRKGMDGKDLVYTYHTQGGSLPLFQKPYQKTNIDI